MKFRNPLGAIFLHVDLLEEELQQPTPESPNQIAEALLEIRTQMGRLDELVQDYLSLVRVSNIELQPEDLGLCVQAWSAEMQAQAAAQGVTLQIKGLEHLGQVQFHASTLRRAVLNLVQNALDAVAKGGRSVLQARVQQLRCSFRCAIRVAALRRNDWSAFLSPYIPQSLAGRG